MRMLRNFIIGLFVAVVGVGALMFIPSTQAPAPMPWEITIMPDGNSKVFDIHLGKTTFRQAQQIFSQYAKTAIFTEDGKEPSVEAFFDSINLAGLSAKLVLNLAASEEQITTMLSQALEAKLQPSGARRYQLQSRDHATLLDAPIIAITYIPSVRLDETMIRNRFGEPNSISTTSESIDTKIWDYSATGLTIRLNPAEKTIIQYRVVSD